MADYSILMLVGYGLGVSTVAVVWALKKLKVMAVIQNGLNEIKLNNEAKELAFKKAKKEVLMAKMEQKNREIEELKKEVLGREIPKEEPIEEEERIEEPKPKPKKVKEIKKQESKKEPVNKVQDIEIEGMN